MYFYNGSLLIKILLLNQTSSNGHYIYVDVQIFILKETV